MKRARHKQGSVVFDKRRKVWNYLYCEGGARHTKTIGPVSEYRTKTAAWAAVGPISHKPVCSPAAPTVNTLVEQYRVEKMPKRYSTQRAYEVWLRTRILPRWGDGALSDIQARPAELWLESLPLTPKSRAHIRGLLRILWEFAMWRGDIATQRNPMELVTIKGASKRTRKPRSLTEHEFGRFIVHLEEPFRTVALVCVCFGLRISECLALKWSDVDWLGSKLSVQRGIVRQRVDAVKTSYSEEQMTIDPEFLEVLKRWKQTTQFFTSEDWVFGSPVQIGRVPWSYDEILRSFVKAGAKAGIGKLGTHTMRHTYRSWLDAVGTPIAVQQKLMRHGDIRTTMNTYGDVVTNEMAQAHGKVVRLALNHAK